MLFNFLYKRFEKIMKQSYYEGWISKEIYLRMYNIYKYNGILTCEICKEPINSNNDNRKASIDHIKPKTEGGNGNIENLRITHRKCNSERKTKIDRRKNDKTHNN